jgi:hypothetical protein
MVVLVSLVGSTPLSAGAAVTVGDAVRPVINHLVPQVWLLWVLFLAHAFLRCNVFMLKQCRGRCLADF